MQLPGRSHLALTLLAGAASALLFVAVPAKAQDAPKPVATVNGTAILPEEMTIITEDLAATLPQMSPQQRDDYLISFAIDLKLVAAAAEKANAVDSATLEKRLAYFRQKILMEQYLGKLAKEAVTEEAMKKLYDDTVKTVTPEEEVRARHILLQTEDEAKKAYDRVKAGEDFAAVAKELSKDPGSSDGGDLGYFTKERMVPEFSAAAFALKAGEISQPVKSQFGWHVIKVEDKRSKPIPPFDQVKPQIADYLVRKAQQDAILKLRAEAKIERPQVAPAAPSDPAAPAAPAQTPNPQ